MRMTSGDILDKLYAALDRQKIVTIKHMFFWMIIMSICMIFRWNIVFFIVFGWMILRFLIDIYFVWWFRSAIQKIIVVRSILGEENIQELFELMKRVKS